MSSLSPADIQDLDQVTTTLYTYANMGDGTNIDLVTCRTQCIWLSGFHHSLDHMSTSIHSVQVRNYIPYFASTTEVDDVQIVNDDGMLCSTAANHIFGVYIPELDRSNSVLASNLPAFIPFSIRAELELAYKKCVTDLVAQSGGSITEFLIHRSICY
jgi:hypothetical protein